jgi:hypothetical protein
MLLSQKSRTPFNDVQFRSSGLALLDDLACTRISVSAAKASRLRRVVISATVQLRRICG